MSVVSTRECLHIETQIIQTKSHCYIIVNHEHIENILLMIQSQPAMMMIYECHNKSHSPKLFGLIII